uniref:Uncharacterized protein n=1 Tax=Caudovirales sp. ctt3K6 TaxID=2826786 RepID=A0A8S5QX06_9CAUD|nr:MAG TPA: hypothetical protein [Caudovirales sp. ctt3K6]
MRRRCCNAGTKFRAEIRLSPQAATAAAPSQRGPRGRRTAETGHRTECGGRGVMAG